MHGRANSVSVAGKAGKKIINPKNGFNGGSPHKKRRLSKDFSNKRPQGIQVTKRLEKTRYSESELAEFKSLIEEKLGGARKELKYLNEQLQRTNGEDGNDSRFSNLEDGTSTHEKEYLGQMASRQITYIDHLEKALVRIANKTYGTCRQTGKLISKERLRAVPHATLCIEAKKAQDVAA